MASNSILRGVAEDERLYWMAATRSEAHSTSGKARARGTDIDVATASALAAVNFRRLRQPNRPTAI
jgi:hypothetical protein